MTVGNCTLLWEYWRFALKKVKESYWRFLQFNHRGAIMSLTKICFIMSQIIITFGGILIYYKDN